MRFDGQDAGGAQLHGEREGHQGEVPAAQRPSQGRAKCSNQVAKQTS